MRIYISGPITGMELPVIYRQFLNAEWKIQELGHIAVNPLKIGSVDRFHKIIVKTCLKVSFLCAHYNIRSKTDHRRILILSVF